MLFVNEQYYTISDLEEYHYKFEHLPELQDCQNKRIAACLPEAFSYIALCLYIWKKGGSFVPIHAATPFLAAKEIACESAAHVLFFHSFEDATIIKKEQNEQEGFLVQMSSGTTGTPKKILRTWLMIEEELEAYTSVFPEHVGSTTIIACPVTHSYGLISGVFAALKRGSTPVIITNSNPKYVLRILREYPDHILYAAPALLHMLVQLAKPVGQFNAVMTSGTLMPQPWLDALCLTANRVLQQYGCSETGCVTLHPDLRHAEEMGRALPHVRIQTGTEDAPGEIVISTKHGKIFTKDIGYVKGDMLCFVTRQDDMINVAGLNVYPSVVEKVLLLDERLEEAVVYKKQDMYAGERVCAQFTSVAVIEITELLTLCQKYLAPHQIPVELVQVDEIKKLPNGKVSRRMLGGIMV
ncbi:AMP-binding protein [Ectobacillus antri]|jgi:acyl-CoA synthetase (AMP-forming)/AMP-acid ligase II|uniref:AMP-binding protein n=1 Tax=Ectobacillus antri TaxID=2486280 RepID=A0ABT6H592_9BACI|nr:AMP-binding protein [Ectobacillus antri]MDG4657353.1 AMP-binding protein [Ectobacillus antri]MDG5754516.1 AMP-binding protein [Ectobacillus antri]